MARGSDVIGWAWQGTLFCPSDRPKAKEGKEHEEVSPVFMEDAEEDDRCDTCGRLLLEHEPDPDRGYKEARDERALEGE